MPSTSKKQHNFMEAVAHSPAFAKKVGVPQSVGKDFSAADKGRKFKGGGEMAKTKKMAMGGMSGKMQMSPKVAAAQRADAMGQLKGAIGAPGGTAGGTMGNALAALRGMKKGGSVKQSSGSASSRADGIAKKGKTQGTNVKMNKGGYAC